MTQTVNPTVEKGSAMKPGQWVLFYDGRSGGPDMAVAMGVPAMVTGVLHGGLLDMTVFPRGSFPFPVDAVRHRGDPIFTQAPALKENGAWKEAGETDTDLLYEQVADLILRVEKLEGAKSTSNARSTK